MYVQVDWGGGTAVSFEMILAEISREVEMQVHDSSLGGVVLLFHAPPAISSPDSRTVVHREVSTSARDHNLLRKI